MILFRVVLPGESAMLLCTIIERTEGMSTVVNLIQGVRSGIRTQSEALSM